MKLLVRLSVYVLILSCAGVATAGKISGVSNEERARSNYMIHCQGCHMPQGEGMADRTVPKMAGFVGLFLHVDGGREFLVQVPGSANTSLDDRDLAELLNWILSTMSPSELPDSFLPYTPHEVGDLRKSPLAEVAQTRKALVATIREN
jgi:mono/diheme cytochrome c family protein